MQSLQEMQVVMNMILIYQTAKLKTKSETPLEATKVQLLDTITKVVRHRTEKAIVRTTLD